MTTALEVQERLRALGYNISADGKIGPQTLSAMSAALDKLNAPKPASEPVLPINAKFDAASAKRLAGAHPMLQQLMNAARQKIAFTILDSQRGREAQEKAFREGHSKAHFGQSAHNWTPAIAVDIAPVPLDWNNVAAFDALAKVILPLAKDMKIPITWGGSWATLKDRPHYELSPWREFAKQAKPYQP